MLKAFCNVCELEINDEGFMFEGTVMEAVPIVASLDGPKQMKKTIIHICNECYDRHLKNTIKKK